MDDDDEKSVWFRGRLSGSGYGPSSWQGWLAVAIFAMAMAGTAKLADLLIPFYFSRYWRVAEGALFIVYAAIFLRVIYTHRSPA